MCDGRVKIGEKYICLDFEYGFPAYFAPERDNG